MAWWELQVVICKGAECGTMGWTCELLIFKPAEEAEVINQFESDHSIGGQAPAVSDVICVI